MEEQNVEKLNEHQVLQFKNIFGERVEPKISKTSNSFYLRKDSK